MKIKAIGKKSLLRCSNQLSYVGILKFEPTARLELATHGVTGGVSLFYGT